MVCKPEEDEVTLRCQLSPEVLRQIARGPANDWTILAQGIMGRIKLKQTPGKQCYTVHVQHLMAGREKEGAESLQIRLCNLNICIKKVDAKSDSSVNSEPQGKEKSNSNSRNVVASSPSFSCPSTRAPQRACSQATAISSVVSCTALLGVSQNMPP